MFRWRNSLAMRNQPRVGGESEDQSPSPSQIGDFKKQLMPREGFTGGECEIVW